jgi:uncharacterized protein (DUF302 family)
MAGDRAYGLIRRRSAHAVAETAGRFRAAAEAAGLTIFAAIDHQKNAVDVGMDLGPCLLLVFGNPRAGTPLMQANPEAGIDLPFKVLIWTDKDGATWFGWNDPQWLARRHGLGAAADKTVAAIAAGMEKLCASATA